MISNKDQDEDIGGSHHGCGKIRETKRLSVDVCELLQSWHRPLSREP